MIVKIQVPDGMSNTEIERLVVETETQHHGPVLFELVHEHPGSDKVHMCVAAGCTNVVEPHEAFCPMCDYDVACMQAFYKANPNFR